MAEELVSALISFYIISTILIIVLLIIMVCMMRKRKKTMCECKNSPVTEVVQIGTPNNVTRIDEYERITYDLADDSMNKKESEQKTTEMKTFMLELEEKLRNEDTHAYDYIKGEQYETFFSQESKQVKERGLTEYEIRKSLGTRHHLKYLEEVKRQHRENDRETGYLDAKEFTPKNECPTDLQILCNFQVQRTSQSPPPIPAKKKKIYPSDEQFLFDSLERNENRNRKPSAISEFD